MRIRIEIDETIKDEEVIIRCKELNNEIHEIQNTISAILSKKEQIVFYKDETEYYLPLASILFFETEGDHIFAHTVDDMYQIRYRLYELEEILPLEFIRVSKSTILNVSHIKSINRNIISSSTIGFHNSHKKTYVSRHYFKDFKIRLMEVRRYHEK